MHLSKDRIDILCRKRKLSTSQLLKRAGVSRNAFYSLVRKRSLVPKSLSAIAETLDVPVSDLMQDEPNLIERMRQLYEEAHVFTIRHPDVDLDNIRHTLILLDEPPIERLRRALRRGRPTAVRQR